MKYKIFVGVIMFKCPQLDQDIIETTIFVDADWTDAEDRTRKYALKFAAEKNLIYESFEIFVQAHKTSRVAECVWFVQTGFLDEKCELIKPEDEKINAKPRLDRPKIKLNAGGKTHCF